MNRKWLGIALLASTAFAQQPKFEVTSVRLNKSPDLSKGLLQFLPGGRFVGNNVPLRRIIATAWGLSFRTLQLTMAPGVRMPDDIYDFEATSEAGTFPPGISPEARFTTMKLMLQSLLEDRFKVRVRQEPKEQPVYVLLPGNAGVGPERSKYQEPECHEEIGPKLVTNPACHWLDGDQDRGFHGESVTIAQVAHSLEDYTDRPLLDKTGLTGFYNIQMDAWAPMRVSADSGPGDPDRPTLFDVLEKIGLHLERRRAVVDMFVIDHVEKPGDN